MSRSVSSQGLLESLGKVGENQIDKNPTTCQSNSAETAGTQTSKWIVDPYSGEERLAIGRNILQFRQIGNTNENYADNYFHNS